MDLISQIALSLGLAWASGIRFYCVVFVFGLLQRLGYITLPSDLALLSHDWVLAVSGVMLLGEFVADKVPAFDSFWDGLQTFVRVPGGALLAWGAFGDQGPAAQLAITVLGGSLAAGTHLGKTGTRALVNHSPEPFSNWFSSFAEDGLVLGGLWLLYAHPVIFLGLLAVFVVLLIWLLPKVWRSLAWVFNTVFRRRRRDATAPARVGE